MDTIQELVSLNKKHSEKNIWIRTKMYTDKFKFSKRLLKYKSCNKIYQEL